MIATVVFAAPPDSGRPSDGCTSALRATYAAVIGTPALLCSVPATVTSIRGMVDVARNLAWVRNFVST